MKKQAPSRAGLTPVPAQQPAERRRICFEAYLFGIFHAAVESCEARIKHYEAEDRRKATEIDRLIGIAA